MRKLLFLLLLVSGMASAQYNPTGSKVRYVNGVAFGTKSDAAFGTVDSLVLYAKADSTLMFKYKGTARALAYASQLPNDSLGVLVRLKAGTSGGIGVYANNWTQIAQLGAGGSSAATFYGFAGYNSNQGSSYTTRSFTDKNFVDSSRALDVQLAGTQTITGAKTFSTNTVFTNNLEASNTGTGVTQGDLFVDNSAKTVYVGRQSTTGGDNSIFTVRNRLNVTKFSVNSGTGVTTFGGELNGGTSIAFTGFALNNTPTSNGTNPNWIRFLSTGSDWYIGSEGSTSGGFFTGSSAYASVLYSSEPIQLITGGVKRMEVHTAGVTISSLGTGTVYSNSGVLTNTNPSDSTLKDSIMPMRYGLAEILKLNPKTFYYKSDSAHTVKYGFIAQDVKPIMPDVVRKLNPKDDKSKLGLETDGIYVTLVKAIQEQQAIIDDLKKRIIALENK